MNSNVGIDKLRPYRLIKQQVGFEKYLKFYLIENSIRP